MLRLCLVCSEYPSAFCGGLGIVTQTLARGLAAAGHTVRVIGLYSAADPVPGREVIDGVEIHRMRMPQGPGGWLLARRALYRQIKAWACRREIDLVEIPLTRGYAAGWRALPVPVVIRYHGSAILEDWNRCCRPPWLPKLLERMALRRADYHCGVSRYIVTAVTQCFKLRLADTPILYNPIDFSQVPTCLPLALRSGQTAVFAGTLNESKGIPHLIAAWLRLRLSCSAAELHLYGADGCTKAGESMTAWLNRMVPSQAATGIFLHGYVPHQEVMQAFSHAQVAVLPSHLEAFGLAAAEAMACGCPTIFTERTAGPELIEHRQSGWLVDPENSGQITAALATIFQHPETAAALGSAGRQRISAQFSLDRLLPQNERFYRECIVRFNAVR